MLRNVLFALFVFLSTTTASTITIPVDYATIQMGLDSAAAGDTVLVLSGQYNENLVWPVTGGLKLIGTDPDSCVVNAVDQESIIIMDMTDNPDVIDTTTVIQGLTLQGGLIVDQAPGGPDGGGIRVVSASPKLENLIIRNNQGFRMGGGLYIEYSHPILRNLLVSNCSANWGGGIALRSTICDLSNMVVYSNTSQTNGGGIYCFQSEIQIDNTLITNNTAIGWGGGIYCASNHLNLQSTSITINTAEAGGGIFGDSSMDSITFSSENRCSIYLNQSTILAASDLFFFGTAVDTVFLDTITYLPTDQRFIIPDTLPVEALHAAIPHISAPDIYINPSGNNTNSGLNPSEPLKNIWFAMLAIQPDSLNPCTVHLDEGTYSLEQTNEGYPIFFKDHVSLLGESRNYTILDASGGGSALVIDDNNTNTIANLTINDELININNSSVQIDNVAMTGRGISFSGSDLSLSHSIISNTSDLDALSFGGSTLIMESDSIVNNHTWGINGYNSQVQIINTDISGNQYGGIVLNHCKLTLEDSEIHHNLDRGLGLSDIYSSVVRNVQIYNNGTAMAGGGIYYWNFHSPPQENDSSLVLENVSIHNNSAGLGGGIYIAGQIQFSSEYRCNIYQNTCPDSLYSGQDLYAISADSFLFTLPLDTFTVLEPTELYASPINSFSFDISHAATTSINEEYMTPKQFNLEQNYPNPFNPTTTIRYTLPRQSKVLLRIFDITGREVMTLVNDAQTPGRYELQWDATNQSGQPVSTGIYFARLQASGYSKTIKLVYLK